MFLEHEVISIRYDLTCSVDVVLHFPEIFERVEGKYFMKDVLVMSHSFLLLLFSVREGINIPERPTIEWLVII